MQKIQDLGSLPGGEREQYEVMEDDRWIAPLCSSVIWYKFWTSRLLDLLREFDISMFQTRFASVFSRSSEGNIVLGRE